MFWFVLLGDEPVPFGRFLPLSLLALVVVVVDLAARAEELGPVAVRSLRLLYLY